jgi:hypothetical protein
MEETDVEFDLAEDVEDCVCGVGVGGHGGGVDLVGWDAVVGGRHCVVCGKDVVVVVVVRMIVEEELRETKLIGGNGRVDRGNFKRKNICDESKTSQEYGMRV